MSRLVVLCVLALWAGTTLLISTTRWARRRSLTDRLALYHATDLSAPRRHGAFSVASFREVIGPLSRTVGERLAALFGVSEQLSLRLERVHDSMDVTTYRVRQLGWSSLAFLGGALGSVALRLPACIAVLIVLGAPLLAFLVIEQQLASRSAAWQRRLTLELPVVAEQLGMLLSSGYSLVAALARVAERGNGACAQDLRRVLGRIRQGLGEREALAEWAGVASVAPVSRLVDVLAFNRETADLARLIGEEARSMRRDAHRRLLEQIEKRTQMVWIPVTVAALVPGVMLVSIPFIEVLDVLGGA